MTFARVQVALTFAGCGAMTLPARVPKILCSSFSIFSSSFGMKGMTLSRMSRPMTPGDRPPVPDRLAVLLAAAAHGGGEPADLEPRVVLQRHDELLPRDAGGAHDTRLELLHPSSPQFPVSAAAATVTP